MLKKLLIILIFAFVSQTSGWAESDLDKLETALSAADKEITSLKNSIDIKEFKDQRPTEEKLNIELLNKEILQLKIHKVKLSSEVSSLNYELSKTTLAPEENFKQKKTAFDKEFNTRKFSIDDSKQAQIELEKIIGEEKNLSSRIKSSQLETDKVQKFLSTLKAKEISNNEEITNLGARFEEEKDPQKAETYKSISSLLRAWNSKVPEYEAVTVDFIQLSKDFTSLLQKRTESMKFDIMFQKYKLEQIKNNEVLTSTQISEKNEISKQKAFYAGMQEIKKANELQAQADITKKEIASISSNEPKFSSSFSEEEIEELKALRNDLIKSKEELLNIREKSAALYKNTAEIQKLFVEIEKENVNLKDSLNKNALDQKEIQRLHEKYLKEFAFYTSQSELRAKEAEEAYKRMEASNFSYNAVSESLLIAKQKLKKEPENSFITSKIGYLELLLSTGKEINNITEIFFLSHFMNKIHTEKLSRMYSVISNTLSPPPNVFERAWSSMVLYMQTSVWPAVMKVLIPLFSIIVIFIFCAIVNFFVKKVFDVTGFVTKKLTMMNIQTQSIDTFRNLMRSAVTYAIYGVGIVVSLKQIGVSPNLSVGGIGVVALITTTFGKTVFENFLNGLFLILENRYSVGDFIEAAGVSGFVEEVSLRTTTIRMVNGEIHIIPNGNINAVKRFPGGDQEARVDIFIRPEDAKKAAEIIDELSVRIEKELEYILRVPQRSEPEIPDSKEFFLRYIVTVLPKEDWVVNNDFVKRVQALLAANEIPVNNLRVTFLTNVEMFKSRLKLMKEKSRALSSKQKKTKSSG